LDRDQDRRAEERGLDADQIAHQVTATLGKHRTIGTLSLRERIELAVSKYRPISASPKPRRTELEALRKTAENLRASIVDALAVQIAAKSDVAFPFAHPGVDADMLNATREYFAKLARNIDRQIKRAEQRGANASKPDRDQCWEELMVIWGDIGGKDGGAAAADFIMLASLPIMGSTVPSHASVVQWLDRRRQKAAKAVAKPAPRRAVG
jgi:hypothetical protein